MASYKSPERNTAVFISSRFPKKMIATDHIHEDAHGKGDVTAIGDNVFSGNNEFTGNNTFSDEVTYSSFVTYKTDGGLTQLLFEKDQDPSTNGAITYDVNNDVDGLIKIRSHKFVVENSNNANDLVMDNNTITLSNLPLCSIIPSSNYQLVNKAYIDDNFINITDDVSFSSIFVDHLPLRNDGRSTFLQSVFYLLPIRPILV